MIGRTFGSYRIIEQVGMGGMATVYKAYDPSTDRYVAIKVLPEHYSHDSQFRARFEREAKAIARLEHPFVLPIFAYGEEDGIAYLVMRYLPTGTLKDRMKQGPMPLKEASSILAQVADALDYAHENHILHRDVKPSNILLDEKGNAYLTDFGIAKMVEAAVELTGGNILGTPAYMSPEQCQGSKDLAPASDQYSLGVTLYEMLTGRTPYQAETPLAIINMQLSGDPLPPPRSLRPNLPEGAEKVILKALAKKPHDRFSTCVQMAKAFERVVVHEAATEPSAPTPPEAVTFDGVTPVAPARRARQTPGRLWPMLALVVLIGIGGAAALVSGGLLRLAAPPAGGATRAPATATTGLPAGIVTAPVQPTDIGPNWALPASFVYDDFGGQGPLNSALWQGDCGAYVRQNNGVLSVFGTNPWGACSAILAKPSAHLSIQELGAFEAQIRMANDFHGTGQAYVGLLLRSMDAPGGHWFAECDLMASPDGLVAIYNVQNFGLHKTDYGGSVPATYDAWHTIRLEADPDTMAFSCYVDGTLIKTVIPSDAEALRSAHFQREIQSWRGTEAAGNSEDAKVTGYVDNVRITLAASDVAALRDQPAPVADDPTLYDDFSDPAFDGKVNTALWTTDSPALTGVTQQNGMLAIRQVNKPDNGMTVIAMQYGWFVLDKPIFFQADVMLDTIEHAGSAMIMFDSNTSGDSPFEEVQCAINGEPGAGMGRTGCWDQWNMMKAGANEDNYQVPLSPVTPFGIWHTLRIEVDPATMTLTYLIDGQEVGTHTPVRADQLKSTRFRFALGVNTPTSDAVTGYFDNVRVGPYAP